MAKETQKEKIARLEAENAQLRAQNSEIIAAYNEIAWQKKPEITDSEEYKALEKQLAAERVNAAEAQKQYKAEAEKREQLRQDYVSLKENYDALLSAYSALQSDFKRVHEELQQMPAKEPHNARGAGRKPKFTESQIADINKLRSDGRSMREIADRMDCSPALVFKIVHKLKNKL